jgi:hypothetical protein
MYKYRYLGIVRGSNIYLGIVGFLGIRKTSHCYSEKYCSELICEIFLYDLFCIRC